jgi:hypothetical protein
MKSALFSVITQRRVVILYRRFGTTYRSHLKESRNPRRNLVTLGTQFIKGKGVDGFGSHEAWCWPVGLMQREEGELSRNIGAELPLYVALYPRKAQIWVPSILKVVRRCIIVFTQADHSCRWASLFQFAVYIFMLLPPVCLSNPL